MRLFWLCPSKRKPVGGIKIIYKHAAISANIIKPRHQSLILHPNTLFYRAKWLSHINDISILNTILRPTFAPRLTFNRLPKHLISKDNFYIIPELWARKFGRQLAEQKLRYAIYVQGGYLIGHGDQDTIDVAYENAERILAISEDTRKCIINAFPNTAHKIQRIHYSIDTRLFHPNDNKECIITYMPRKLPEQSKLLRLFLRHHLPRHWTLQAIDGLNELQTAALLRKSRIFLAFSLLEGCPLPPLEAALSGNHVIGYHGQGGKEYWTSDIFELVEFGNLDEFKYKIIKKINEIETRNLHPKLSEIEELKKKYSPETEYNDIKIFLKSIGLV
jgi:glycosyltransferase involved in cell wall biosynthesis